MARADSSVIISRFRPRVNPFFNLFLTLFESFSSESGFSRGKSCIFLRHCWKNAEFESFAFNRKICGNLPSGFASLPDCGWFGRSDMLFRFEPVSIAECSAFCSETTSPFLKWSYVGLPPKPQQGTSFPAPSLRCARLNLNSNQKAREIQPLRLSLLFYGYRF